MTRLAWNLMRLAVLLVSGVSSPGTAIADGISIWSIVHRDGQPAAPLADGLRDYLAMINARDGGVNGVALVHTECDAGLSAEGSAACYDKAKATAIAILPLSSAVALDVLPRAGRDGIATLSPGTGPAMVADGRYFPWAFAMPATGFDGAQATLQAIAGQADALKGKTIALLRLDGPETADTLALLQMQAARLGFTLLDLPVAAQAVRTQLAQWQEIRRSKPDYVVIAGLGAMLETALTEAHNANFPMRRLVGTSWSTTGTELALLGDGAKGYRALSWNLPGVDAQILHDIAEARAGADKTGDAAAERAGLNYQRGVIVGAILVEAIRVAQSHFNRRDFDRTQLRWTLEHLNFDDATLAALGLTGMVAPFSTSCSDHAGRAGAWLLEWNGRAFIRKAGPLMADRAVTAPMATEQASRYATANKPWITNVGCQP